MRYLLVILPLILLAACDGMGSNMNRVTDSTAGVQLTPSDSIPNMPTDSMDTTARANMPVVDPDTSRIQPK